MDATKVAKMTNLVKVTDLLKFHHTMTFFSHFLPLPCLCFQSLMGNYEDSAMWCIFNFKIYNSAVTSQPTIKQHAYGSGKKSKLRIEHILGQDSLECG